jgi:hydrogenase/urease accessory protein HupE
MKRKIWTRLAWLAPLLFLATPRVADAHLVTTGFGPFYDGISHLVLSPDDLLGVLAMALLAGLGGAPLGRRVLLVLPLAWLAGGMIGIQAPVEVSLPVANTLSFLIVGALVAADRRLPGSVVTGLAVALGALHGIFNGTAMAAAGGGLLALMGIAAAVFVVIALVSALVVSLRKEWARIVVRVAGSWIAAVGLLMLGWAFRGTG